MNEMSKAAITERERQIDICLDALECLLADDSLRESYELRASLHEIGRRLNEERHHLGVKKTYLEEQEKKNLNSWGMLSPSYEWIQAMQLSKE